MPHWPGMQLGPAERVVPPILIACAAISRSSPGQGRREYSRRATEVGITAMLGGRDLPGVLLGQRDRVQSNDGQRITSWAVTRGHEDRFAGRVGGRSAPDARADGVPGISQVVAK